MMLRTQESIFRSLHRAGVVVLVLFSVHFSVPAGAQAGAGTVLNLPRPGAMVHPTPQFRPAIIRGVTIHPNNPLLMDFIVDQGDSALDGAVMKDTSATLVKYFLAALTTPEDQMWVNLSPYERDRIVPPLFGETEMGRDLLAQDYLLKQLTSSLMYPGTALGGQFWEEVFASARQEYGTTEIPLDTFHKVWIVPQRAVVFEYGQSAYIVESRLKVMVEDDYLALMKATSRLAGGPSDEAQTQILRELIIPAIETEVNEGQTFAPLRQIYHSMILATWYKTHLKESLLGQAYADQGLVKGIDIDDKQVNRKIYAQYIEAFRKGVYNYIQEDYDPQARRVIPRKYFSGGVQMKVDQAVMVEPTELEKLSLEQFATFLKALDPAALDEELLQGIRNRIEQIPAADRYEFAFLSEGVTGQVQRVVVQLIENIQDEKLLEDGADNKRSGRAVILKAGNHRIPVLLGVGHAERFGSSLELINLIKKVDAYRLQNDLPPLFAPVFDEFLALRQEKGKIGKFKGRFLGWVVDNKQQYPEAAQVIQDILAFQADVFAREVKLIRNGKIRSVEGEERKPIAEKWQQVDVIQLGGGIIGNKAFRKFLGKKLRQKIPDVDVISITASEEAAVIGATLLLEAQQRRGVNVIGVDVGGQSVKIGLVVYDDQGVAQGVELMRQIVPDMKAGVDGYYGEIRAEIQKIKAEAQAQGYTVSDHIALSHPGKKGEDGTIAKGSDPNLRLGADEIPFDGKNPLNWILTDGESGTWGNDALAQALGGYYIQNWWPGDPIKDKTIFYLGLGTGLGVAFLRTDAQGAVIDMSDDHFQKDPVIGKKIVKSKKQQKLRKAAGVDDTYGGIDLNASIMDLQIQGAGRGVALPIADPSFDPVHVEGFSPYILHMRPVQPVVSVLPLLGVADLPAESSADTSG
ncbi:MAG: hypothetical protein KC900_13555 [Candidatus Omnitrophica bacterium]|nr:hypothetical protein [Candidatus Omnitrophota bacterium]